MLRSGTSLSSAAALLATVLSACIAGEVTSTVQEDSFGDARAFRPDVQLALERAGCPRCHEDMAIPMRVEESPTTEEQWLSNYREVAARLTALVPKATGSEGHDPVLSGSDTELAVLRDWTAAGAPYRLDDPGPGLPPPSADAGVPTVPCDQIPPGTAAPLAFCPTIQRDLEDNGCTGRADCHGMRGIPMMVGYGPETPEQWRANYEEVAARAGTTASSLLLAKPIGVGGHLVVLPPDSPVLARWRAWITRGAPEGT